MTGPELEGDFVPDTCEVRRDGSLWVTLAVTNAGSSPVALSLPHGISGGLTIRVLSGGGYSVAGMEREPEPGLTAVHTLQPGAACSERYDLSRWLTLGAHREYVIECAVSIPVGTPGSGGVPDLDRLARIETSFKIRVD